MLFMALSAFCFFFQVLTNKKLGALYDVKAASLTRFHIYTQIVMAVVLLVVCAFSGTAFTLAPSALLLAALYAVIFVITIILVTNAFALGSLGVSTLIINLSMLISVAAGLIFWHEEFNVRKGVGIACVLATLVLSALGTKNGGAKGGVKWLLLTLLAFVGDGSLALIQKAFKSMYPDASDAAFVLASAVCGLVVCAVVTCINKARGALLPIEKPARARYYGMALIVGVSTALGTVFSLMALKTLPALIVFPARQGALIVAVMLFSVIRYKDRFDLKCALMLLFGGAGILLLNL